MIQFSTLFLAPRAQAGKSPWETFPFSLPGQDSTIVVIGAKLLFLLLILGSIALLLRWLFGPGGFLREPWMDEKLPDPPRKSPIKEQAQQDAPDKGTGEERDR